MELEKGDPSIESFSGKEYGSARDNEFIHHCHYKIRVEAEADITKYITLFYNQQRIHKGLDFKTQNQMAKDFYKLVT